MYANYFYDTSVIFGNSIITYREPFIICIGHDRRTDVIGIDWSVKLAAINRQVGVTRLSLCTQHISNNGENRDWIIQSTNEENDEETIIVCLFYVWDGINMIKIFQFSYSLSVITIAIITSEIRKGISHKNGGNSS